MATRSRWGGVETRQSAVQQKVTIKREAQRTFRVKERQRGAEPLSSPRSVQQVFGGGEPDPYPRAYQRLNTFHKSDDSDSSGGWERDSLEGGRHRAGRLAKSVTTANLHAGTREARARSHGLSASRSSTSINETGVQKPRAKTGNIDRLVDRLSKPQKRESRSGSTDAGPGRRRRSDAAGGGRGERVSPARKPAVEFRRSNTFDLDDEPEEDALRVRRREKKAVTPRGRTQAPTPPCDLQRSNTFEKDVDEAPGAAPSVAWPSNVEPEDEDASVFQVNTRRGPEPARTSHLAGTFTRRKKTELSAGGSSSRWSVHSDDGREDMAAGMRKSTENMTSLFARAGLATRDKTFMSSTPDLSAFTPTRDYGPFPGGRKERTRAQESPDSSVTSVLSRKARDVTFEESPLARDRTPRGGRVDFDEILERASRRRRPSAGSESAASGRRGSFSIDRPAAESGQSSYRSVFASEDTEELLRVKSSPHVPKLRDERREAGARGFAAPEPGGRGDGYSRHFRGIFNKARRDSDESDNSGKDTGFSSGRSNSPRDSMPPDSLSRRGGRPGGSRLSGGRLFDREATISPPRSQRSSSPNKSGSTTPRRQPSPDRRLTPSPTRSVRSVRSSARSAGSPERSGGSRRTSAASSVSDVASLRSGRGLGARAVPPPEEQALVEEILAQEQDWMRELTEEDEDRASQRSVSRLQQPPSLPTRDIDSDSVTAPELVSDSETGDGDEFDRTLEAEFDRMQLHSTQQEESVSAHERQLTAKEELIAFTPADDTLKKRPVNPVGPSPAAPDVAQQSPSPSPTPAVSSQEQKTQELMLQEKLLKRDREIKTLQETVLKLKQQLAASQTAQQRMAKVAERHAAALAQLAASKAHQEAQQAQQLRRLTVERDEAREEVANIETMFADLHRKYEKSKALVSENRQSSDLVSAELDHALSQVSREQQRYDMLQQYAEDTMQRLQTDMELEQKSQETEALRMSARLQLAENRATKLERENQEVTAICDELIQKMGGHR